MKQIRVTIQYKSARQPYDWKNLFVGTVLYHDEEIILVRGAGSHSIFYGEGHHRSVGTHQKHPAYAKLPLRTRGFRVHPKSLKRLKDAQKKRKSSGTPRKA